MTSLENRIACVTPANRHAKRGIARSLGMEGATVIVVTGRNIREASTRADLLLAAIDDTAKAVDQTGGRGIAIPFDHIDDRQVQAQFGSMRRSLGIGVFG